MSVWKKIAQYYVLNSEEEEIVNSLTNEYIKNNCIKKTCTEMLQIPDNIIINFYDKLSDLKDSNSPVAHYKDSSWMNETDYCFVNVRATGVNKEEMGNFIQAAKLLPVIRTNGIHLAPFTSYSFECIYAIKSNKRIAREVINKELLNNGIKAEMQLNAFVDACHLLDKVVGFDLEPHTTQFSSTVLENPELFRWIKLSEKSKNKLWDNLSTEDIISEENQKVIIDEIKKLVKIELEANNVDNLNDIEDEEKYIQANRTILKKIISHGYWTIPTQVWSGHGVPEFHGYNYKSDYAKFNHLSKDGDDHNFYAFNILTPYKFYSNLTVNKTPHENNKIEKNEKVIEHFTNIFSKWRDEFNFDFVRYDSVDNIFNSIVNNDYNSPASDRPTPEILRACIENSKNTHKPYIGNLAERMGFEIDEYYSVGFDAMLGGDMFDSVNKKVIERSFDIYEKLAKINNSNNQKFTVAFCIDTHDTGDPNLLGEDLVKKLSPNSLKLRHYVSRFMGAGNGRRAKYEVMGYQDRSHGLAVSNVNNKNLKWKNDKKYNLFYNYIEDTYEKLRITLNSGEIVKKAIFDNYSWWIIKQEEELLVCSIIHEESSGEVPEMVEVNLEDIWSKEFTQTKEYDFFSLKEHDNYFKEKTFKFSFNDKNCVLYHLK